MCGHENRTELPLASSAWGCSCCSAEASSAPADIAAGTAEFAVAGLTCGHCVQSVEKAVAAVDGVSSALVKLVPGGRSRLLVGGSADDDAVRKAVTSAGSTLISH